MARGTNNPVATPLDMLDRLLTLIERELAKGGDAEAEVIERHSRAFHVAFSRISFWGNPSWKIKEGFLERWEALSEQIKTLRSRPPQQRARQLEQLCLTI